MLSLGCHLFVSVIMTVCGWLLNPFAGDVKPFDTLKCKVLQRLGRRFMTDFPAI